MSRRTVVRVGVTAAWTAPAITVLAASPAFASGSGPAQLVLSPIPAVTAKGTAKTVNAGVKNVGGQPAASLQATVYVDGGGGSGWGSATSATISQWTLSSDPTKITDDRAKFVFTASPTDLGGGEARAFAPTITLPSNGKTGTMRVVFSAVAPEGVLTADSSALTVP